MEVGAGLFLGFCVLRLGEAWMLLALSCATTCPSSSNVIEIGED